MKKANVFLRIALALFVLASATMGTFMGSGTYAKYVAAASGSSEVRVAKFHVTAKNATAAVTTDALTDFSTSGGTYSASDDGTTIEINLFANSIITEKSASATASGTIEGEDSVDANVHQTSNLNDRIAPGTNSNSKFAIAVQNWSEVSVSIQPQCQLTGSLGLQADTSEATNSTAVPMGFFYGTFGTGVPSAFPTNALTPTATMTNFGTAQTLPPYSGSGVPTTYYFPIGWSWNFYSSDNNDKCDTYVGVNAKDGTIGLKVKILATQVD
ncbi:MAG: hypothetical protein LBR73_07620 [Oscillospiraceae bacterium]|jgi:hypothetical protein|nr:hypothetical protein [Oscillospiraceae bacterium]